ncbi:MAG TPA: PIG-L family deacetylase, partial [Gemmatimonadales bacterium]
MLALGLPPRPLTLLCLGAHADDIEIGCGGSILRLLDEHPGSTVRWVVFSASPERRREAEQSAALLLAQAANRQVSVHDLRDGCLPAARIELKDLFEQLKHDLAPGPDLIFTHFRDDRHQDHRTISDLTWETFRDHLVLEYEVPKYDGDLGAPNTFISLPEALCRRKVAHLLAAFPSQRARRAFDEQTFNGLMRLRGLECAAADGYAEGFHARKVVLGRGQ